tara:strand:+ start:790 stop:2655 length:1866 start_codon:yes stop_codon:yes gene_type:complete
MALQINNLTGEIDVSASTPGKYIITRTVTNSNSSLSSSATDIVTINPADNAAFSYSGSPFDIADATNPTPTVTGLSGGTFSSISGFNFDGTDYITLPSITLSNDFAFSFWFYTASSSALMFFFGEGSNWCRIDNGVFDVKFSGYQLSDTDPSNQPTFTIPTNQWNNVILVKDSNSLIQVYFNGQVDPNYTLKGVSAPGAPPPVNASFSPGLIGRRNPQYFTGKLSSFALWNSDQSSNISNIYNNGVPQGSYTSTPSVWYKMSNDATYNSSTSTWSIPNAANPGTLDASSTTLPSNSLDYLDINSSTGLISLSTSNVGTYSVSYNTTGATGSICPATDTQSVQLVNTNFNYPSNLCNASGSPNVTPTNFIQQTGGQFTISPTSGLTINASSGVLSPANSTAGTYAITYTIGSNSTTKNVTSGSVLVPSTTTNTSTLSFNGTSSYIASSYSGNVTALSLWFKPNSTITTSTSPQYIINFGGAWNGVGLGAFTSALTNELIIVTDASVAGRSAYTSSSSISADWHHLLINWSGSVYEIWLDGTNVQNAATGTPTLINASSIEIGRRSASPNYYFNGEIDEVAIWDTQLTSCDVAGIYQASSNGITADLSTVYPSNLKYYNRMGD